MSESEYTPEDRDTILKDAIDVSNKIRVALGEEPVADLLHGFREEPTSCPIGRTINHGIEVDYGHLVVHDLDLANKLGQTLDLKVTPGRSNNTGQAEGEWYVGYDEYSSPNFMAIFAFTNAFDHEGLFRDYDESPPDDLDDDDYDDREVY